MKYLSLIFLVCACQSPEPKPPMQIAPMTGIDSAISNVEKSQNRFYFILGLVQKRDSFRFKKYENEVLYYQTQDDRYRRRGNRFIDSVNKYVRIIDSVTKTLN